MIRFLLYCHVTYTSLFLKETIGAVFVNLELFFPELENSEEAFNFKDHVLVTRKQDSGGTGCRKPWLYQLR